MPFDPLLWIIEKNVMIKKRKKNITYRITTVPDTMLLY